jgi:acyl-CoA thioester hydrolase
MSIFTQDIQVRWSDIDSNRHLRHSVYYDYAATVRVNLLSAHGLTSEKFEQFMIGPVLFREEAIFKREIVLEDKITVTVELLKATEDYGRWSIRHQFLKNGDTLAAIVTVDGAWIDLSKRKLAVPNEVVRESFAAFPKSPQFEWITLVKK